MAAHASQTSCADTELVNRTDRCSIADTTTDKCRQHNGHSRSCDGAVFFGKLVVTEGPRYAFYSATTLHFLPLPPRPGSTLQMTPHLGSSLTTSLSGAAGYTNLTVSKRDGTIELDPHVAANAY
jgi:hypothetical protein